MAKRILIVDDQEDIRLLLGDRLEKLGYEVRTASNGEEGMNKLNTESFDGMLLDLNMPVMDGVTMLKLIQKQFIQIPVIIMSGTDNNENMIEAVEIGAKDYLFKPISFETLKEKCLRLF